MNKKRISIILLIIFLITLTITITNIFIEDSYIPENQTGTLKINNKTINYEKTGKCVEVIDANTIQVYGVGRVQLVQVKTPDSEPQLSQSKKFVEDNCLGKTVYLDIDNKQPKDKYDRTLAIVYTNNTNVNHELINKHLTEISYFAPSEFEKGKI